MFCKRCNEIQSICLKKLDIKLLNSIYNVHRIDCRICKTFIGVTVNNEIINIDDTVDINIKDGWKKAKCDRENLMYYILSQIIYPELDFPREDKLESIYDCADIGDDIFLRWKDGKVVGFYTIKTKGSEVFGTSQKYSMNTLDTAYVRSEYRNQGLGSEILCSIIKNYPNDDVGFSRPISEGMLRIIKKFLTRHQEYRLSFWEIEHGGIEGSVKLTWFNLRKRETKVI